MDKVEVSPAVQAAAEMAASEADKTSHKEISVGLMLIGLCKLDEVDLGKAAKAEFNKLCQFFSSCDIDKVKLQHKMEELIGQGTGKPPIPVPYDKPCRGVIDRAKELTKDYQQPEANSYLLLLAMLEGKDRIVKQAFNSLAIDVDTLRQAIADKLKEPAEPEPQAPPEKEEEEVERVPTPVLDRLGVDLVQLAKEGKIRPILNRKEEMRRIVRTLMREEKNNPILTGEAGVGKSVIVRGLVYRIAEGNVIPFLKSKRIVQIAVSSITGGGGDPRGKLNEIIDEVKSAPDVIIFIDEIHTLAEHGVSIKYGLAEALKTALAAGEFPLIGATTTAEYRKCFQEDAFKRRFQQVKVGEPSPEVTREILEAAKKPWEDTRYVHVSPGAIKAAIDLTVRYISRERLPDKAKSVLEDACIKVQMGKSMYSITPGQQTGRNNIGEVTEYSVCEIVSERIDMDVCREISETEQQRLETMAETLKRRVIGQDEAVDAVVKAVKRARTGVKENPNRPTGIFLFVGPTGVGKTQLVKSLAEFLFGSEDALARLDMGQYQQEWEVSRLQGPPPGYVGYDEGGDLTNILLDRPHSVVLLDEIEKAHPKIFNALLSLFDDGKLKDNHFRVANGSNAIFIMTSNIGSHLYRNKRVIGPPAPGEEGKPVVTWVEIDERVRRNFSPEFLNRCDRTFHSKEIHYPFVMFKPLTRENTVDIARIVAGALRKRMTEQDVALEFDESAIHLLAEVGFSPEFGARELQNVLREWVATPLSDELLHSNVKPGDKVTIKAEEGKFTFHTKKAMPKGARTQP